MGHKKRRSTTYAPFFTFTPQMIYVVQKGLRLLEAPLEHANICDVKVAFAQETMVQVKGKLSALLASACTAHTTTFDYNEKIMITSAVQLYSLFLVGRPPSEQRAKELQDCYQLAFYFSDTTKELS